MRQTILIALAVLATTVMAADRLNTVPEQAAPVYAYVKAVLTHDIESFKNAHTKRALAAYKQPGGINELFKQIKLEFPGKFKGAKLADFSFTAKKQKYAIPGGSLELDGEYYMVMMNVERVGGRGVFVEKEDDEWKITIPRDKNLQEFMKKAKAAEEGTPNRPDARDGK